MAVGGFGRGEQHVGGRGAAFGIAAAVDDVFGQERQVDQIQRGAVAAEAFGVGLAAEAVADVGDAVVTKIDQVAGGLLAGGEVIDHHRVDDFAGVLVVEQDDGHAGLGEHLDVDGAHAGGGDDDAVHAAFFKGRGRP